jgi:CHAT domain-containing protein
LAGSSSSRQVFTNGPGSRPGKSPARVVPPEERERQEEWESFQDLEITRSEPWEIQDRRHHGENDPSDPSKSKLLLHDHTSAPFTVASLATVDHNQLELVYLSACRTAFTRPAELLDEAIQLTAFQLAGSRHVIGTSWDIGDAVAADIATAFYTGLRTSTGVLDTDRAAVALHEAVHAVRGRCPHMPSFWASHLHAGA